MFKPNNQSFSVKLKELKEKLTHKGLIPIQDPEFLYWKRINDYIYYLFSFKVIEQSIDPYYLKANWPKIDKDLILEVNLKEINKEYWKTIQRDIFKLQCSQKKKELLWKEIKKNRYYIKAKLWEEVLPKHIVTWARDEIHSIITNEECECVDNSRVARMDSPSQMRRFRKQRENGCCESVNRKVIGPDGNYYLIGFNCGH